ncbi:MAG: DUF502 domain-containing protein [Alphaproteobacteria bacterium]|nr:DUF502 domain-containing protein [Alphaproteobacteria bacterium SS10]
MSKPDLDASGGGPAPGSDEGKGGTSFLGRLRNYLITGILVTAPIAITISLVWLLVDLVDTSVEALLPVDKYPVLYLPFQIPGSGLILSLVTLIVIGWFAAGVFGRFFVRIGENIVARMPIIRSVYGALKQIFETVLAQQSNAFRQVVLLEYPRRGIFAIGFVTGVTQGEVQNLTDDTVINIFLPTTPNPTSGFLLFVPKRDLVVLDMTVEEGIKMVISGGIVTPPDQNAGQHQEIAENLRASNPPPARPEIAAKGQNIDA